jgi:hypothetical protein
MNVDPQLQANNQYRGVSIQCMINQTTTTQQRKPKKPQPACMRTQLHVHICFASHSHVSYPFVQMTVPFVTNSFFFSVFAMQANNNVEQKKRFYAIESLLPWWLLLLLLLLLLILFVFAWLTQSSNFNFVSFRIHPHLFFLLVRVAKT